MKSIKFAASVLAVAAATALSANAFAADFNYNNASQLLPKTTSTLSRAEVVADYLKAAKEGTLVKNSEAGYTPVAGAVQSTVTRAEVRAEALHAAHSPQVLINPSW